MKITDVINLLEELAPQSYAEDFDNTGLLVGDQEAKVSGILVTLDTLEEVVDEAIANNCNLIVSFHPIIFSGLKKLTGATYVERTVLKAIKNNIAIFAIHTALDNAWNGVNKMICDTLMLEHREILIPKKNTIKKLTTYVPTKQATTVRESLFKAGAGAIGNYTHCSFNMEGEGSFKGNKDAKPVVGTKESTHFELETQIGVTFPTHLAATIISVLKANHPYEEVAYEVTTLENTNQHIGMGMIGVLPEPMPQEAFLNYTKKMMQTACIRHSKIGAHPIRKVAVLGGSGSFALDAAKRAGADAFVSADFKYHDFFKAEGKILVTDIGHYESEQFTKDLLVSFLTKKISNFAPALPGGKVVLSQTHTNPISYL